MASVVNGMITNSSNSLNTQINSALQSFNYIGSTAVYSQVSCITGSIGSLLCATGNFGSMSSAGYYNSNANLLTVANGFYAGSLSNTGTSTGTWNTVVNRNYTVSPTTGPVSGFTLPANSWNRITYNCVATVPANSKVTAGILSNGTLNTDSISVESNLPPTSSIGTITAVVQTSSFSGTCHLVPASTTTVGFTLASTSGTSALLSGQIELISYQ